MASDEIPENVVPFPRGSGQPGPMGAREQYQALAALADSLVQGLHATGWVKMAARTEFERGMVHDAALIAGTKLDLHVTGRLVPDNAVLVAIDEDRENPLQQRPYGPRPRSATQESPETLPPSAEAP